MTTAPGAHRRGMLPEDIGALRQVEAPRVSPDGQMVAFTVMDVDLEANRYRHRIWLASTKGEFLPRPISAGPDDELPRWSPDGRLLAFSVNPSEGRCQICALPVAGPGERLVVALWPAPITELAWSPEGTRLAFVARVPDVERYGRLEDQRKPADMPPRKLTRLLSRLDSDGWVVDRPNQVMVVPSDGTSAPKALTGGLHESTSVAWSPDGSRLAFASARHPTWDLDYVVDLWVTESDGTGSAERLTANDAAYMLPAWSPDGTRIAYLYNPTPDDEPRHARLGVIDVASRARVEVAQSLDRNCFPHGAGRAPAWFGDDLLCSVEDAGNVHLYAMPASGDGKPVPVVEGELWLNQWDWAGGTLAMAVAAPGSFPELFVRSLQPRGTAPLAPTWAGSGSERKVTALTASFAANVEIAEPARFTARSKDGTEVPCWAIAPVGAEPGRRYPTLLNVHGGPFTSYGNRFFDEFQLQAGAGFGVLFCNPRGSSGYAESWGRAVRWPECANDPGSGWGGVDFEDVLACAEEGARQFSWADPNRLGILGGSYGGYMTSWAIGHTDRFKAGCSERACNNLLALEANSDFAGGFSTYIGARHIEAPLAYLRQSPITYVKDMKAPLLILHSEDDLRCPVNQAEELFVALRILGREPVFVRFPGESHELSRSGAPKHRLQRAQIILDWFHEKLGP
ncbi:MAG TPA: S9 family peptidase [Acidimicrobiales bacterium]|nr:S9 family peptidase [Acidimicrobiales bacterium]